MGYIYYGLAVIIVVGIVLIGIGGPEAGWSSFVGMVFSIPYWGYLNAKALICIIRGDVTRHKDYNLRAFTFSLGIILIRLIIVIVMLLGLETDPFTTLKTSLWMGWLVSQITMQ